MRIVLDTNILLVAISSKSPYYPIFESFLNEEYTLCVTTEILLEYEEILKEHRRAEVVTGVLDIIENAPNTLFITRYFEWELIKADLDDNKFVDCAIACNAKLIVTEDKHFNILKLIPFPKVYTQKLEPFITETLEKKINWKE